MSAPAPVSVVQRSEPDGAGVVTLTLDDGKVNSLDTGVFHELSAAFQASSDAAAVVLAGRTGFFSAGLNTKTLPTLADDELRTLLETFGRTLMTIWLYPRPVVAAATGHAVAAGTMLAMVCDHAVAAAGDYRWGLAETQIGFLLPEFAIAITRGNVRADRVDDLLLPGAVIGPDAAVEAGFADALAPLDDVIAQATAKAHELAKLPIVAYADTKVRLRGGYAQAVLANLERDIDVIVEKRPTAG